jgi:isopropylmalate/homocitrate/citramalate synthase
MSAVIAVYAMDKKGEELILVDGFENDNEQEVKNLFFQIKKEKDKGHKIDVGMWSIELYINDDLIECFPVPSYEGYNILTDLKRVTGV